MFGKIQKEESLSVEGINGFVGKAMSVEGALRFDGTVRVDGRFNGEIHSNGTLIVGEDAHIEAKLNVDTVVVSGEIKGFIFAKNKVELRSPARVLGDIRTPTLIIGEGVIFEGNCVMTKKEAPPELKSTEGIGA